MVAREAARLIRAHGGGAVVNIASISGQRGNLGRSAHGASKGGVITLTQAMQDDAKRSEWLREVPQRRYPSPHEIAGAAVLLLDDAKASFVTGHILNVDGGFAAAGYLPVRS